MTTSRNDKRRKLTADQVIYIRSMKGRAKHVNLAHKFGVDPKTIQRIQKDVYWDAEKYQFKKDELPKGKTK